MQMPLFVSPSKGKEIEPSLVHPGYKAVKIKECKCVGFEDINASSGDR